MFRVSTLWYKVSTKINQKKRRGFKMKKTTTSKSIKDVRVKEIKIEKVFAGQNNKVKKGVAHCFCPTPEILLQREDRA